MDVRPAAALTSFVRLRIFTTSSHHTPFSSMLYHPRTKLPQMAGILAKARHASYFITVVHTFQFPPLSPSAASPPPSLHHAWQWLAYIYIPFFPYHRPSEPSSRYPIYSSPAPALSKVVSTTTGGGRKPKVGAQGGAWVDKKPNKATSYHRIREKKKRRLLSTDK